MKNTRRLFTVEVCNIPPILFEQQTNLQLFRSVLEANESNRVLDWTILVELEPPAEVSELLALTVTIRSLLIYLILVVCASVLREVVPVMAVLNAETSILS